jgi:predicted transglutaminase-like cysteine proteinase
MRLYLLDCRWPQKNRRGQFPGIKLFVLLAGFLLNFSIGGNAGASSFHDYLEVRVENRKIEDRLRDWAERTKEHGRALETSDHHKISKWREQLHQVHFRDERAGLLRLNAMINGDVDYRDDYSHYHKADYWADPQTVLEEGGDCEDIALLKAASLRRLNWPIERLQLLVGYLIERGKKESHAVLLVQTREGHQLVLRSLANEVVHPDHFPFIPLYAVGSNGVFVVRQPR